MVAALLASLSATIACAFVVTLLFHRLGNEIPETTDRNWARISPDRISAGIVTAAGLLLLAGSLFLMLGTNTGNWPAPFALIGAVLALFMAPALSSRHDVLWKDGIIEGPCQTFGLTLGPKRCRMSFRDILKTGKTGSGYWYIEDAQGNRIYWSYLYRGHLFFRTALQIQRDDLELPAELQNA